MGVRTLPLECPVLSPRIPILFIIEEELAKLVLIERCPPEADKMDFCQASSMLSLFFAFLKQTNKKSKFVFKLLKINFCFEMKSYK